MRLESTVDKRELSALESVNSGHRMAFSNSPLGVDPDWREPRDASASPMASCVRPDWQLSARPDGNPY